MSVDITLQAIIAQARSVSHQEPGAHSSVPLCASTSAIEWPRNLTGFESFFFRCSRTVHLDRVFSIMGMPNVEEWPEVTSMPAWHADTDGIRTTVIPDAPLQSRLSEHVQKQCKQVKFVPHPAALGLLSDLLTMNPSKRITAQQALQHAYFTQVPHHLPS